MTSRIALAAMIQLISSTEWYRLLLPARLLRLAAVDLPDVETGLFGPAQTILWTPRTKWAMPLASCTRAVFTANLRGKARVTGSSRFHMAVLPASALTSVLGPQRIADF